MLTERASLILHAWDEQLITSDEVRQWADNELRLAIKDPAPAPVWLLDLVQFGPQQFGDASVGSWCRTPSLRVQFAFRATRLDLQDRRCVDAFAHWLSRGRGEELTGPELELAREVTHYLDGLEDPDLAIGCVRARLPALIESCKATIRAILG